LVCDITIIAEAPKMRPYIDVMRANIAADLSGEYECYHCGQRQGKLGLLTGRKEVLRV